MYLGNNHWNGKKSNKLKATIKDKLNILQPEFIYFDEKNAYPIFKISYFDKGPLNFFFFSLSLFQVIVK